MHVPSRVNAAVIETIDLFERQLLPIEQASHNPATRSAQIDGEEHPTRFSHPNYLSRNLFSMAQNLHVCSVALVLCQFGHTRRVGYAHQLRCHRLNLSVFGLPKTPLTCLSDASSVHTSQIKILYFS